MNVEEILESAMASTEANGMIVGLCETSNKILVCPCWEAGAEDDVARMAIRTAIAWADKNGSGDLQVCWHYRDDTVTCPEN